MKIINSDIYDNTNWIWYLKGCAILGIVLFHWFSYYLSETCVFAVNFGGQGVHVFIILSAFGIYLSYEKSHPKWGIWCRKRFFKIILPYYSSILLVVFSILIFGVVSGNVGRYLGMSGLSIGSLVASVLLYRAFIDKYVLIINSPWWFIVTILELYLIFPLLYRCFKKYGWMIILGSLVITVGYEVYYAVILMSDSVVYSKFFLAFLFEYTSGIILADIYINRIAVFKKITIGLVPFMFGLLMEMIGIILAFHGPKGRAFNDVFNSVGYFLILINIVNYLCKYKIITRSFYWLGRYSLSIFLVHAPYIYLIYNNYRNGGIKSSLVYLPGYLIVVGSISYIFQKCLSKYSNV